MHHSKIQQREERPVSLRSSLFPFRLVVAGIATLAGGATLILALLLTDLVWTIWERLRTLPPWLIALYAAGLFTLAGGGAVLVWRLLVPPRRAPIADNSSPPDPEALRNRMQEKAEAGVDVSRSAAEFAEYDRRKATGQVYVAFFGEISTGKSALIRALLPDAQLISDPRGGTTWQIHRYQWVSPAGDRLLLTDLPGLNEASGALDPEVRREALRAHYVVYVVEGDLTRDQEQQLRSLMAYNKPLLLALNKIDRYSSSEQKQIRQQLQQRLADYSDAEVVAVQAGGREELIRVRADGQEERVVRERSAQVAELARALQKRLDRDPETLERMRDTALFLLASEELAEAERQHLQAEADALVNRYAHRAVLGALASVAPGSDLIIQGTLAVRLIQELCQLYEVSPRQLEIDAVLQMIGGRLRKQTSLILGVAGNALKAFPGVGTLAGGAAHAVAYGLIFESLGRSVAHTLASRGELRPQVAARAFEEELHADFQQRAKHFAQLALAQGNNASPRSRQ